MLWGIWLTIAGGEALAQPYPTHLVRIIVPAASGSALEINARKVADKLGYALGQAVVVLNKPGANGIIGMELAAEAKPDDYTPLMGSTSTLTINPSLYPSLPCNPLTDFAPVTLAVRGNPVVLVSPSLAVKTLGKFIELAKRSRGNCVTGRRETGRSSISLASCWNATRGSRWCMCPTRISRTSWVT